MNRTRQIPFDFILDYLHSKDVLIKPMFGCFGLYVENKICFFLRDREKAKELNGVWIAAATPDDYESLAKELPSIKQKMDLVKPGKKSKNRWLLLSAYDRNFESLVLRACELVVKNDRRIGKITKGSI